MRNTFVRSLVLAAVGSMVMFGSATASLLPDLTNTTYKWNDSDYWAVTDLDGTQGAFELRWENPGASYESSFGLYSLVDYSTTTPMIFEKHEIFAAYDEPVYAPGTPITASVWFEYDVDNSIWQISGSKSGLYKDFGNVFGFYSDVYTGPERPDLTRDYTWYTDARLNDDKAEHFAIAYDQGNRNTQIYLEDRWGGIPSGVNDSVDLMVTSSDLVPVPEPAIMLLFGTGLVGLVGVARKRKNQ